MAESSQQPSAGSVSSASGYELRVAEVIAETAEACSIVFEIPPELARTFRYKAGQFVTLHVPFEGKTLSRCYSLASSPDCERAHKVTVKRIADGRISNWLNDHLKAGDHLRVLPPGGLFTLNRGSNRLLFFAGGSGITPVISLIKTTLETTSRSMRLLYANRDQDSIIFRAELEELGRRYRERLEIVHHLDQVAGFATAATVREFAGDDREAEVYICGPAEFMDVVEAAMLAAGTPEDGIHLERFVSPPDPDAHPPSQDVETAGGEAPEAISVYLDGRTHEVSYKEGQTVLEAVQDAGLEPPFSCTEGFCGCCMAKLRAGRVRMKANDFLSAKELEQGWVLTCQSVPVEREITVEYPD